MSDQFYITLPSNTLEENTASNFRNILPQRIRLEGEWEVGLAEIIYPNSWNHLTDDAYIDYEYHDGHKGRINLTPGFYNSRDELFSMITGQILHYSVDNVDVRSIEIGFDNDRKRVIAFVHNYDMISLTLSKELAFLLGFTNENIYYDTRPPSVKQMETEGTTVVAKYMMVPLPSFHEAIYVYSSIVEDQVIGNTMAPLLRIVDIQGKHGDIICKTYDSPHYVPVLLKDIVQIEINLKTDMNEFLLFKFGKVVVKLHVRRKNVSF